jgi:dipeptidyl aminopeptidase/acylaminoacyl peptidase
MSAMTDDLPPHLRSFVLPHEPVEPVRSGALDLYLPDRAPAPAVLMVHGGPVPADRPVRPPQWPAFRAYGALLAQAGLIGAMVEHGFVDDDSLGAARDDVSNALTALRADDRVDADRVGLWFFSGGGYLMGSFLDPVPGGVVAVAGTYAAVGDEELPDIGLVDGIEAAPRSTLPLLLVRPEHDFDWIVPITDDLLARCSDAGRDVDVIDVPGAHHGFETVDDTDAARDAIRRSVAWWAAALL